jgi:hypothetical protein
MEIGMQKVEIKWPNNVHRSSAVNEGAVHTTVGLNGGEID